MRIHNFFAGLPAGFGACRENFIADKFFKNI